MPGLHRDPLGAPVNRDAVPEPTRTLVVARAHGRCERCGVRRVADLHHRRPRGMGGARHDPLRHRVSCLVLLCRACHDWIEHNRAEATDGGWLVSHWDDTATTPLRTFLGGPVLLADDGSTHPHTRSTGCNMKQASVNETEATWQPTRTT